MTQRKGQADKPPVNACLDAVRIEARVQQALRDGKIMRHPEGWIARRRPDGRFVFGWPNGNEEPTPDETRLRQAMMSVGDPLEIWTMEVPDGTV